MTVFALLLIESGRPALQLVAVLGLHKQSLASTSEAAWVQMKACTRIHLTRVRLEGAELMVSHENSFTRAAYK